MLRGAEPVSVTRGRSSRGSAWRRRATRPARRRDGRAAARPRPRRSRRAGRARRAQDRADVVDEPRELQLAVVGVALARAAPRTAASGRAVERAPRRRARRPAPAAPRSSSGVTPGGGRYRAFTTSPSSTWSTQVEPFSMRSSSSGTPRALELVHEVADHVAVAAQHDRRRSPARRARGRASRPRPRRARSSISTSSPSAFASGSTVWTQRVYGLVSDARDAAGARAARRGPRPAVDPLRDERPKRVVALEACDGCLPSRAAPRTRPSRGVRLDAQRGQQITIVVVGQPRHARPSSGQPGDLVDLVVRHEPVRPGPAGPHHPVAHDLRPALVVPVADLGQRRRRARPADPGLLLAPPAGRSPRTTRPGRTCPSGSSSRRSGAGARAGPRVAPVTVGPPARPRPRPARVRRSDPVRDGARQALAAGGPPGGRPRVSGLVLDLADHPGEHARDEHLVAALGRARRDVRAARRRGHDRVLVVAEHVLERRDGLAESRAPAGRAPGRPPRPRSGALRPDPDLVELLVGRDRRASALDVAPELLPRASCTSAGRTSLAGASASGSSAGARAASTSRSSSAA